MPTTSRFRPSRPCRSGKFSTSCNCRLRPAACALWAKRSRSSWRRASSPPATPPRRSWSNTRSCPAVSDVAEALSHDAPTIWPNAPGNLALDNAFGDRAAVEAAIARAHVVIEQTIRCQRTASAFMEPRSAIGRYDEAAGQYILISGCQGVHRVRHPLADCLKVPQERVRVICPDVGGGFGSRTNLYPEQVAVVWAARRRGTSGEMDRRSPRGIPHRLHRARCGDRGAARASTATAACWRSTSSSPPISARIPCRMFR